jgi:hypothetical protein
VSEKSIARQLQFILDQIECEVPARCHFDRTRVASHQHAIVQAVDDDSVGDDAGDEENDEPVSSCGPSCATNWQYTGVWRQQVVVMLRHEAY